MGIETKAKTRFPYVQIYLVIHYYSHYLFISVNFNLLDIYYHLRIYRSSRDIGHTYNFFLDIDEKETNLTSFFFLFLRHIAASLLKCSRADCVKHTEHD